MSPLQRYQTAAKQVQMAANLLRNAGLVLTPPYGSLDVIKHGGDADRVADDADALLKLLLPLTQERPEPRIEDLDQPHPPPGYG